jgi:membrane protease YdiL (CAAX protease family)
MTSADNMRRQPVTARNPAQDLPSQMSLGRSILLHLLPGALLTLVYFLIAPSLMGAGYPALTGVLLAILFVLIPFELGVLLVLGVQRNGRLSLEGVAVWREHLPWTTLAWLVPVLVVWGSLCFVGLSPFESLFASKLFAWMPAWSLPSQLAASMESIPGSKVGPVFAAAFALNGIAGPVVEELYFRGYLLPRVARLGTAWAVVWNVVLFSLYHFFSPWGNLTRILALLPIVYMAARKRNIYVSMLAHCSINTLGMIASLITYLGR